MFVCAYVSGKVPINACFRSKDSKVIFLSAGAHVGQFSCIECYIGGSFSQVRTPNHDVVSLCSPVNLCAEFFCVPWDATRQYFVFLMLTKMPTIVVLVSIWSYSRRDSDYLGSLGHSGLACHAHVRGSFLPCIPLARNNTELSWQFAILSRKFCRC